MSMERFDILLVSVCVRERNIYISTVFGVWHPKLLFIYTWHCIHMYMYMYLQALALLILCLYMYN